MKQISVFALLSAIAFPSFAQDAAITEEVIEPVVEKVEIKVEEPEEEIIEQLEIDEPINVEEIVLETMTEEEKEEDRFVVYNSLHQHIVSAVAYRYHYISAAYRKRPFHTVERRDECGDCA